MYLTNRFTLSLTNIYSSYILGNLFSNIMATVNLFVLILVTIKVTSHFVPYLVDTNVYLNFISTESDHLH